MKLIPNAGRTLLRSWTLWLVYLAGLLDVLPYVVPYLDDYLPPWLSIACLLAAPLARIVYQPSISGEKK